MKAIIISHLVILKSNPTFKQLKELEQLVKSDDIKNNGKIIVKCDFQGIYKEVKKDVAKIFDIKTSLIYLTTTEI